MSFARNNQKQSRSLIDILAEAADLQAASERPAKQEAPRSLPQRRDVSPSREPAAPDNSSRLASEVESILRGSGQRRRPVVQDQFADAEHDVAAHPSAPLPVGRPIASADQGGLPSLADVRKISEAARLLGLMADDIIARSEMTREPQASRGFTPMDRPDHSAAFSRDDDLASGHSIDERLDHMTMRFEDVTTLVTSCLGDLAAEVATLRFELNHNLRAEPVKPVKVPPRPDAISHALQDLKALRDQLTNAGLDRNRPIR